MPRKIYYGTKKRDYKSVGNSNLVKNRSNQFFKNLIENFSDSILTDDGLVRLHEEKAGEILRHFFILSLTFKQRALFPKHPPIHFVKKVVSEFWVSIYFPLSFRRIDASMSTESLGKLERWEDLPLINTEGKFIFS